jgi:hypothetical protein
MARHDTLPERAFGGLHDILEKKCVLPVRKKMHLIHLTCLSYKAGKNDLQEHE